MVVDNAKAALSLVQAIVDETDITDYNLYLEDLSVLESEYEDLVVALELLIDKIEVVLPAEKILLLENKEKALLDKIAAEENIENLEEAVDFEKVKVDMEEKVYENTVTLSVPVIGFYGDWSKAPMFDALRHEENSFYNIHGLVEVSGPNMYLMSEVSAFSPNGDGTKDSVIPYVTVLRNLYNFKAEVVNQEGQVLRRLGSSDALRKTTLMVGELKLTF